MAKTRFGDTVPYFHIAKEYGLDYGDVLMIADLATHGRLPSERKDKLGLPIAPVLRITQAMASQGRSPQLRNLDKDMSAQLIRFREIQGGAEF